MDAVSTLPLQNTQSFDFFYPRLVVVVAFFFSLPPPPHRFDNLEEETRAMDDPRRSQLHLGDHRPRPLRPRRCQPHLPQLFLRCPRSLSVALLPLPANSNATVIGLVASLPYDVSIFAVDALLVPYGFGLTVFEIAPPLASTSRGCLSRGGRRRRTRKRRGKRRMKKNRVRNGINFI
uniref:Uncharacterized protein n=1 Tax=Ananas comosus var. bracteatus TaxID=296719 RepID=A0A6V7NIU1_ANACO|nr:unnamed protein product [Ananas comosus var. bracteatus]